jgi:hypothetical protein
VQPSYESSSMETFFVKTIPLILVAFAFGNLVVVGQECDISSISPTQGHRYAGDPMGGPMHDGWYLDGIECCGTKAYITPNDNAKCGNMLRPTVFADVSWIKITTIYGPLTFSGEGQLLFYVSTMQQFNPYKIDRHATIHIQYGQHDYMIYVSQDACSGNSWCIAPSLSGQVQLLKQNSALWAGDYIDETKETLGQMGCFLTSLAMVINYYAAQAGVTFTTSPAALNVYLDTPGVNGFDYSGYPRTDVAVKFAENNGVPIGDGQDFSGDGPTLIAAIQRDLANNNPVMLQIDRYDSIGRVPNGQHWVVATGFTADGTDLQLVDPYRGLTTLSAILMEYTKNTLYTANVSWIHRFTYAKMSTPILSIGGHSPIELLLTDANGQRIGYNAETKMSLQDLTGSYNWLSLLDDTNLVSGTSTHLSKRLNGSALPPGVYQLSVIGTSTGSFTIDIAAPNDMGAERAVSFAGITSLGSVATYTILYAPNKGVASVTPGCTFILAQTAIVSPAVGLSSGNNLTVTGTCSWQATTSAGWITLTGNGKGAGSGTVLFSVAPNHTGSTRSGTISVAGMAFSISQPSLSPGIALYDFAGNGRSGAMLYDPNLGQEYSAVSNGDGTFQYVPNLFTAHFDTLRSGDCNGDGKADLVLYNSHTALGYIGMGNGDGTFAFQSLFWSPGYDFVEAGDLNGDGKTDFALYNSSTGTMYTAISNGDGTFTYKYRLISKGYTFVRLADFTGDGKADIFLYNATDATAYLGVGDGLGGFTFNFLFISPGYTLADVGDLNGDGKADLILYNPTNGNAATGISDGAGGFTFNSLIFSPGFTSVRLGDYTGDGKADVTVYNKSTAAAYFGTGTGTGTFTFQSLFWSPNYNWVEPEDVNGDGKMDIILYNSLDGTEYTGISNGNGTFSYTYKYWGIGKVLAR